MVQIRTLLSMKGGAVSNNVNVSLYLLLCLRQTRTCGHRTFKALCDLCFLSLPSLISFPNTLLLACSVSATLPSWCFLKVASTLPALLCPQKSVWFAFSFLLGLYSDIIYQKDFLWLSTKSPLPLHSILYSLLCFSVQHLLPLDIIYCPSPLHWKLGSSVRTGILICFATFPRT